MLLPEEDLPEEIGSSSSGQVEKATRKGINIQRHIWYPDDGLERNPFFKPPFRYIYDPVQQVIGFQWKNIDPDIKSMGPDLIKGVIENFHQIVRPGLGYMMNIGNINSEEWFHYVGRIEGVDVGSTRSIWLIHDESRLLATSTRKFDRNKYGPPSPQTISLMNLTPPMITSAAKEIKDQIVAELGLNIESIMKDINDNKIMEYQDFVDRIDSMDNEQREISGPVINKELDNMLLKRDIDVDTYKLYTKTLDARRSGRRKSSSSRFKIKQLNLPREKKILRLMSNSN